jgi:hypothetical protein
MGLPNNLWVKKRLKRRGCGESFLRHKGGSEYSSLPPLTTNSINAKRPYMEGGRTKGFTGIPALFYPQILLKRQKDKRALTGQLPYILME